MARLTLTAAANKLLEQDNILVLCHRYPDGDTIGSAFALGFALRKLGKKVNVMCGDIFPSVYSYIFENFEPEAMKEKFVVAVDVADRSMLGMLEKPYGDKVDLCIDHHGSNSFYAKDTYVDANSASAGEIIWALLPKLGVEADKQIANALYTAVSTDTGCFKYSNTTPKTLRTAAKLLDIGADGAKINTLMFDTMSMGRLKLERAALESIKFYCGGKIASVVLTSEMFESSGASEGDLEGLSSLPRKVEGVVVGIFLRETANGYKASVRTHQPANACTICKQFGGGGHSAAAGSFIKADSVEEALDKIVEAAAMHLGEEYVG
ncbi:MAG: bifunctional oligoribonuclease/PAP phosphatase NrnA [Clostridia bacterium]|nr:bifunctional oligoribonuclease/PAP phosphatase NrnA [Oscillospiraceae bacterium]MBQ6797526.1 bifunctional oligoribonuclease/PAP phosphatase NrnA [Clostridia bacterium]